MRSKVVYGGDGKLSEADVFPKFLDFKIKTQQDTKLREQSRQYRHQRKQNREQEDCDRDGSKTA